MAGPPVVDIWVNLLPPDEARKFLSQEQNRRIEEFFGSDVSSGTGAEELLVPWWLGGPLGAPVLGLVWRRNLRRLRSRFPAI